MKLFDCNVLKGKTKEPDSYFNNTCDEVIPEYIKFTCRKCDSEMDFDIKGEDFQEEYFVTCPKCKIEIVLPAASG